MNILKDMGIGGGKGLDIKDVTSGHLYLLSSPSRVGFGSSEPNTKRKEIKVNLQGMVRTRWIQTGQGTDSYASYAYVYVNGIQVSDEFVRSTSSELTYTFDVSVSKGDLVQIYAYSPSGSGSIEDFKIGIDGSAFGDYFGEAII